MPVDQNIDLPRKSTITCEHLAGTNVESFRQEPAEDFRDEYFASVPEDATVIRGRLRKIPICSQESSNALDPRSKRIGRLVSAWH